MPTGGAGLAGLRPQSPSQPDTAGLSRLVGKVIPKEPFIECSVNRIRQDNRCGARSYSYDTGFAAYGASPGDDSRSSNLLRLSR